VSALRGLILAFDYGERHIGVATGQPITGSATPLTTLQARDGRPDWKAVRELVSTWQPVLLVVGLPLNMDGTNSVMADRARRFAARLTRETSIETRFADERLTSFAARRRQREKPGGRDGGDHALAAALIAETWLASEGG
jgi:putative Holliday junction resolvase